jgi:Zn-dependent protease/predicted transcriptional regulator
MNKSIRVFRVFGISIEIHYSWFFVFFFLAWGLSTYFFPEKYPELTAMQNWILGIFSSLMLFVSVLVHELSHSLVAKRNNIDVKSITLFFFGGVANISGEENLTPKKEFTMSIAGPISSLILAGIFFAAFKYSGLAYVKASANYLYIINLMLALFNLAPGYPLDGGRILRAAIWGFTNDIKKATRIASTGGKAVAIVLMAYGFFTMNFFMVLLGLFLYFMAETGYEQIILKDALQKVKVKEIMIKEVRAVSPELSLAEFFEGYLLKYGVEGALVAKDNVFLGIVTINAFKNIPKQKWPKIKVKDVLIRAEKIPAAKENDSALKILSVISEKGMPLIPVLKNKKLIGAVSAASLLKYAQLKSEVS